MATQSLTEAAVTGHIMGIDPGIIVFFPPLGGYALLGNLVICLSGQVTLALGAIETTDSNQLHVSSYLKITYNKDSAASSDKCARYVDEVYFCKICSNKVRVVEEGIDVLICCGEPMNMSIWSDARTSI
jgi:desulfoferrodoxin-like iron-binding protein